MKVTPKKFIAVSLFGIAILLVSILAPFFIKTAYAAPRCLDFDGETIVTCQPGFMAQGDVPLKADGCYKSVDSGFGDEPSLLYYEEVPKEQCDLAAPPAPDDSDPDDNDTNNPSDDQIPAEKIKAECDTALNAIDNTDSSTDNDCRIIAYLRNFINILTALVGIVSAIMIAIWGIQYTVSRDNPQMVADARRHILMTVLAVGIYFMVYAFLQWLVPGGIF